MFILPVNGQKVNVDIKKTLNAPIIDGEIDFIWEWAEPVVAEKSLFDEQPTVTVTWRALCCDTAIFVLLDVKDDNYYTAQMAGGNDRDFDLVEIYFDINDTLVDNQGPLTANSGHWRIAPAFVDSLEGIEAFHDNWDAHDADCYDSYVLTGSNYVREYRIPWKSMYDKNFDTLTIQKEVGFGMVLGFDICIIDRDTASGAPTYHAPQRIVWQNDGNYGDEKESWESMDDCGTITLNNNIIGPGIFNSYKTTPLKIYPNPVKNQLTVEIEVNSPQTLKIELFNLPGEKIYEYSSAMENGFRHVIYFDQLLNVTSVNVLKVEAGENIYYSKIIRN